MLDHLMEYYMNNEILILGRLGKNPDLRYTRQKQKPVCTLSVAVNDEEAKETKWHRVVVWDKQAELAKQYLKKGDPIFAQGRIQQREFRTEDGELKKYQELNADLIGFSNL